MKRPTPEQIKASRLICGLTQTQAAQMIHVDMTTWQRYEYGNRKIPLASWELFLIKTGQIIRWGQRDNRGNGTKNKWGVFRNGEVVEIDQTEARDLFGGAQ